MRMGRTGEAAKPLPEDHAVLVARFLLRTSIRLMTCPSTVAWWRWTALPEDHAVLVARRTRAADVQDDCSEAEAANKRLFINVSPPARARGSSWHQCSRQDASLTAPIAYFRYSSCFAIGQS